MDDALHLIRVRVILDSLDPCAIKFSALEREPMILQFAQVEDNVLPLIHAHAQQTGKDLSVKYPLALVCLQLAHPYVVAEAHASMWTIANVEVVL